ncbi:zinc finger (Ran-binding) family protein [Artemisia annua]|uniref:Zinc finger (Ran-binding) family protein n=1 Tax=Artemisia annua TaxID=35608 RepID=A0A2U1M7Z4_ARTAN|nr:zinc finger (Ran-binding) family protein [Artemisia annua]
MAYNRWLSRNDIEVLINDVYPYLFKGAHETERRMRSFLQVEGSKGAKTLDLMKYILNFVSTLVVYPERSIKEATESSVRSLLHQMNTLVLEPYDKLPRNLQPNNTKKGDWICPKKETDSVSRGHRMLPSHPWPEWSRFIGILYNDGYADRGDLKEFVENQKLPLEFLDVANVCLFFASDRMEIIRWLSRNDIEVLINDVYPYLFKGAHETERRMRSFLQVEGSKGAKTLDLMKYILNFVSTLVVYPERSIKEATESSVRSLLHQMNTLVLEPYDKLPRNLQPNNTKKGDWICPKCSFKNFTRNSKCLECVEPRPRRQLSDGEWDCPRCNYLNYVRNTMGLKCQCKRLPTHAPSTQNEDTAKEDKAENWFKKCKRLPTHAPSTQNEDTAKEDKAENWFKKMSKPVDEFSSRHSDSDESNHEDVVSDNEKPKQQ